MEATALIREPLSVDSRSTTAEAVEDPDWAYIQRVAEGDDDAFAYLVERHQGRILSVCDRLLGDPDLARDACQEVFLKLFRHAARFEPRARVSTWLYRIATNYCLNRLRRKKIVRWLSFERGSGEDAGPLDPPSEAADPESEVIQRQRWRATRRAIEELPANQKSVLVLAKFEGLSYREIAEVLDITTGAVESRLFRAMRRLERSLDP